MGLQRGRGCKQTRVHPSNSPQGRCHHRGEVAQSPEQPNPFTLPKEVLVTREVVPTAPGVTRKHGHSRALRMVYLSQNEQRGGKMLGKSPNRRVSNSKHKPDRDLVCRRRLHRAARRKLSWKRHRSPGLCHRRLRSAGSHPSPGHGRRNRLHCGAWTRIPSLNKLFYTMYKETQTVPLATTPMAPGNPCAAPRDASSPSRCRPPPPRLLAARSGVWVPIMTRRLRPAVLAGVEGRTHGPAGSWGAGSR